MQRIIVKQQFGNQNQTFEAQYTSLSYSGSFSDQDEDDYEPDDLVEADEAEDDLESRPDPTDFYGELRPRPAGFSRRATGFKLCLALFFGSGGPGDDGRGKPLFRGKF